GATRNRYLSAVSAVLRWCHVEWSYTDDNAAKGIRRSREPHGREVCLTCEQLSRLYVAARRSPDPRLLPLAVFGVSTGARGGQLMHLRWRDVDTDAGTALARDTKIGDTRLLHFRAGALDELLRLRESRLVGVDWVLRPRRMRRDRGDLPPTFPAREWRRVVPAADLASLRF